MKKARLAIIVGIVMAITVIAVFPVAAASASMLLVSWENQVMKADAIVIGKTDNHRIVREDVNNGYIVYELFDVYIETVIKGNTELISTRVTVRNDFLIVDTKIEESYISPEPEVRALFYLYQRDGNHYVTLKTIPIEFFDMPQDEPLVIVPLNIANEIFRIVYYLRNNDMPVLIQPSASPMQLTDLIMDSEYIMTGLVTSIDHINKSDNLVTVDDYTRWTISVDKILKGDVEPEIMVRADTGPIGSIEDWLWDVPVLEESDKVVLFLTAGIDGCYSVVGGQRSVRYLESDWYEPVENQSDVICNIVSVMRENDIPVVLSRKDLAECRGPFPVWAIVAVICGCCAVAGILVWRLGRRSK